MFLTNLIQKLKFIAQSSAKLLPELHKTKMLVGKQLSNQNIVQYERILNDITLAEFSVFSQWGDDGIIQFLVNYLDLENKTFVEFGVEKYWESNTRFLLFNNNWRGLIMDGSKEHIENIKKQRGYWRFDLTAKCAFITRNNVMKEISDANFNIDLDLLHIDIDGNDYWIWLELVQLRPSIVIFEYNAIFGASESLTIPYKEDFQRFKEHYSGLYFGASLRAFYDSAIHSDYSFIGCNSNGNNAYFVRNDKLKGLKPKSIKNGFVDSNFRESRDKAGNLTFLCGAARRKEISGMPVFNIADNKIAMLQ